MSPTINSKAENISWALLGLAAGDIHVEDDGFILEFSGRIDRLEDIFGDRYEFFFDWEAVGRYRSNPDQHSLKAVLESGFDDEGLVNELLAKFAQRVPQGDPEDWLGNELWQLERQEDKRWIASFEQMTSNHIALGPEAAEADRPGRISTAYAFELGSRFPRMIKRAVKLSVVAVRNEPDHKVNQYLSEASKCYIYGFFRAAVLLCRAAMEFAFQDYLMRNGRDREIAILQQQHNGSLAAYINLAESLTPTGPGADIARRAKDLGNRAAHEGNVTDEECKEMFFGTRAVLTDLYA